MEQKQYEKEVLEKLMDTFELELDQPEVDEIIREERKERLIDKEKERQLEEDYPRVN